MPASYCKPATSTPISGGASTRRRQSVAISSERGATKPVGAFGRRARRSGIIQDALLSRPWASRSVPDVNDHHFVAVDTVIDPVRIGSDPKRVDAAPVRSAALVRLI